MLRSSDSGVCHVTATNYSHILKLTKSKYTVYWNICWFWDHQHNKDNASWNKSITLSWLNIEEYIENFLWTLFKS